MNAVEIEEAVTLLAEQPFIPTEFPFAFLEAFGNKSTTIKLLRYSSNKSDIANGVLQRNHIHIAVCEEGEVTKTLTLLRESPATIKAKAKFILATDGKEFQAEDLNSGESVACSYPDFHDHFGFFLPLAGISTVKQIRENAFDIKATSRLNKLYVELLRHNPEWAKADRRHDMNHFLARLIFCFFAEDTGIFEGDSLFTATVQQMSASDASDTHDIISELFRAMDTKHNERTENKIKKWATKFPYVNGDLFSGSIETPKFSKIARSYLLHVGNLDWKKINPDIFGSMIQAVADEDERSALGMHYTSVPNILKVLNPLFLNNLRAQLEEACDNPRKLLNLRKRISHIRVFDPACGSGNFLVIAYKQMREIEYEINKIRGENDRPTEIPLTNFRGIELRDFSAEVARLALIIAEFQCDVIYRGHKLALAEFLPLKAENWITCGNALRINWLSVCPPTGTIVKLHGDDLFSIPLDQAEIDFKNEGGETYICGNPPYKGTKNQNPYEKKDLEISISAIISDWKVLDYVCGWFLKAAQYSQHTNSAFAFVSTNSICQGNQVPVLWPALYQLDCDIYFAHSSFKWSNLAASNAGVTVIIIGLSGRHKKSSKMLFDIVESKETVRLVDNINPYLTPGKTVIVKRVSSPSKYLSEMKLGNQPYEGGFLVLDADGVKKLNLDHTQRKKYIRKFIGSSEFINGTERYCLWIENKNKDEAIKIHAIKDRVQSVYEWRMKSDRKGTVAMATKPHQFSEMNIGKHHSIIVPIRSSENREYLPVGLIGPDVSVNNLAYALYDAPLYNLSIIASRIHLVWIAAVCGRLETRFSYSNKMGWNTFPVPPLTEKNKEDLTACAEEILIARERHFPATIADLYDPNNMPEDLRRAHNRNDEVLERIYIGRRFKNDTERLEKLFDYYTQIITKEKAL